MNERWKENEKWKLSTINIISEKQYLTEEGEQLNHLKKDVWMMQALFTKPL